MRALCPSLRGPALPGWLLTGAILLALAGVAAACGGSETPAPATFDISLADSSSGGSSAEFQPKEFAVVAGQTVTFNISNAGQAVHTLRIAGADNQFDTTDDAVAEPYMIYSKQKGALTWTAPKEPGTYRFRCDFHLGSVGTVVVK